MVSTKFPIDIPWGKFDAVYLTFWPNSSECRTGGAAAVMQTLSQQKQQNYSFSKVN